MKLNKFLLLVGIFLFAVQLISAAPNLSEENDSNEDFSQDQDSEESQKGDEDSGDPDDDDDFDDKINAAFESQGYKLGKKQPTI